VTTGTSSTTFSPNGTCTREQIVTFLYRAASLNGTPSYTPKEMNFSDVQDPSKYYYEPILWAYSQDITTGISKTEFDVGNTCIRAMIVTLLKRYDEMR
ncbi:MAG: S-layer homology domain-containing protein, partial [Erysipelotrichaceae bacterium]|nr:S-layer homology domain-containing protein [Erysipelotrichaceae bacterium]